MPEQKTNLDIMGLRMPQLTMKSFRTDLVKLLDAAYLEEDKTLGNPNVESKARLDTLKEIAELAGVPAVERRRCAYGSCPAILERRSASKYCSNACKQKAYRVRHGQMRK